MTRRPGENDSVNSSLEKSLRLARPLVIMSRTSLRVRQLNRTYFFSYSIHVDLRYFTWCFSRSYVCDRGFVTRYVFIWTRPADLINARSRIMYTSRDHLRVGSRCLRRVRIVILSVSVFRQTEKKNSYLLSRGGKVEK